MALFGNYYNRWNTSKREREAKAKAEAKRLNEESLKKNKGIEVENKAPTSVPNIVKPKKDTVTLVNKTDELGLEENNQSKIETEKQVEKEDEKESAKKKPRRMRKRKKES